MTPVGKTEDADRQIGVSRTFTESTPAPVAPTAHLVVGGCYRYVRNPMYLALVAVIIG